MRLSHNTIALLRNFSKINTGLRFEKGDQLRTISAGKTFYAEGKLDDECPTEATLYSLNEFLSLIARSEHPLQLSFDTTASKTFPYGCVTIQEVETLNMIGSVACCQPQMVITPPFTNRVSIDYDLGFDLTAADLVYLKKQSDEHIERIMIRWSGDTVRLQKMGRRDSTVGLIEARNTFPDTAQFDCFIKTEDLKRLMPGPYSVQITKKNVAHFLYKGFPLEYWMPTKEVSNSS